MDPGQRREMKIRQYRMEKEWREKVEVSWRVFGLGSWFFLLLFLRVGVGKDVRQGSLLMILLRVIVYVDMLIPLQSDIPGISLSSSPLPALAVIIDTAHPNAAASSSSSSSATRINLSESGSTSVNPEPTSDSTSTSGSGSIRELRSTTLSLLTLLLINTSSSLSSIEAEIDLLSSANMSAQIIEEDQERRAAEREESRRKQEGEREGLREEERWRLDMGLVRRRQRGKVRGLIDDRGKVSTGWAGDGRSFLASRADENAKRVIVVVPVRGSV